MLIDVKTIDEDSTRKNGLPPEVFKDEALFDEESNKLFRNGWASVACTQQLPEPGDVLPVRIGDASLMVVRRADGEIGVFHNICRHKGAPLVDGPCNKRVIVCPYHRWTFQLDGDLRAAPVFNGDGGGITAEERADKGLLPVRFEIWWDTVFVNVSGDAQPFADFIRPLDELLSEYDPSQMKMISTTEYESTANWKLAVDNFLDGYHVPFVHSQAVTVQSVMGHDDLFLSEDIMGMRLPTGATDKPAKTDEPLPIFSHLTEENKGTQLWFGLFPNTLLFVDPVWVQLIIVRPESAKFSRETLTLFASNPEAMDERFAEQREGLSAALNQVNEQDIELLDKLQITRSSPEASQGQLSENWDKVNLAFQLAWLKKMQE